MKNYQDIGLLLWILIFIKNPFVDAFNLSKISNETQGIIAAEIYFEKIKKTYIIDNTTYNQPEELIKKNHFKYRLFGLVRF